MDPRKLKLMLLPYQGYMNEADDGDDLGGEVLDLEKPDEKTDPEDRGDNLEVDKAKEDEPKPEDKKPEPEKAEEADPKDKQPGHIPKSRFDEVIAERNAEREANAELKRRLEAYEAATKTKEPEPKKEEAKSIDALELEYANLMMEGDVEKAVKLRGQINAAIREQAEAAAEQKISAREDERSQKAIANELAAMSAQVVKDYPYLDTEEGALVIPQITALRDAYVAKGESPANALRKAADFIAPKFDPNPQDKDEPKPETKQDGRPAAAIARGIKDSAAQPPQMSGVGNRAMETVKRDVTRMSEEEFEALPESEKRKMRGD